MRFIGMMLLLWLMAACSPARAGDGLARVQRAGELKVLVVPNAPWAMRAPDGGWQGFDIDVARQLAADLGVKAVFQEQAQAGFPAALLAGADVAVGGLMIRPDLARSVVYSRPIGLSVVRTVVAGPAGALPKFDQATRIAVVGGSVAEAVARATYPEARVTGYANGHDAAAALLGGGADALVGSSPLPRLLAGGFDGHVRLAGPVLAKTAEALALRPDDARLQAYVNNWVDAKLADGWLQHRRHHWFVAFGWMPDAAQGKGQTR